MNPRHHRPISDPAPTPDGTLVAALVAVAILVAATVLVLVTSDRPPASTVEARGAASWTPATSSRPVVLVELDPPPSSTTTTSAPPAVEETRVLPRPTAPPTTAPPTTVATDPADGYDPCRDDGIACPYTEPPACTGDPDPWAGCDNTPPWLEDPFVMDEVSDALCQRRDNGPGDRWWCPPGAEDAEARLEDDEPAEDPAGPPPTTEAPATTSTTEPEAQP